MLISNYHIKIG